MEHLTWLSWWVAVLAALRPLVPFAVVLLAIAAIPRGTRTSDRWASGALGLLWLGLGLSLAVLAVTGRSPAATALAGLALAEAGVLFVQGTLLGLLPLRPRPRPRTVLGGALLVGVLAGSMVEVLRSRPELDIWEAIPVASVTLAVLLVGSVPAPRARWVVPVPMLFAATGGLGTLEPTAIAPALHLAGFVAGLVLVFPDGDYELTPGYRLRERLDRGPSIAWTAWLSVLALAFVVLAVELLVPAGAARARRVLLQTELSLAAVATLATISWLRFPAWGFSGFRLTAWRVAILIGWLRRWLSRGWNGSLVIVAGGAILYGIVRWTGVEESLDGMLRDGEGQVLVAWPLVAILALVGIGVVILRMRRRIFVCDFSISFEKDDTGRGAALAARLRNELGSIAALYRTIDEALPARKGISMELELTVTDVAADLEGALGQDFSISAAGTKIPVGRILGRFRGLWRGPRLTGTLHREGSGDEAALVLTAEITGGGKSGTWRVSVEDLVEQAERNGDPPEVAYALVRQLAYRIVAALTAVGSPRWEAVHAFTEGLRAYRKVQRTRSGRHAELRRAEAFFLKALQADQRFVACYYNLGTVYSQLGESNAAAPVFREAITADPDNVAAYVGLAQLYFGVRDHLRSEIYARKAIDLDQDQIRAWILWGVAWVLDEIARHESERSIPEDEWIRILGIFRAAPAVAWKNLCRQELSGTAASRAEARGWVSICLNNLAEAYFVRGNPELGEHPVREALEVEPREPFLHLALGKCLVGSVDAPRAAKGVEKRLAEAGAVLYRASDEGLRLSDRGTRWAWLLRVHAQRDEKDETRRAFRAFLDSIVPGEELTLTTSRKVIEEVQKTYRKALRDLLDNLSKLPPVPGAALRHSRDNLKKIVAFLTIVEGGPVSGDRSPGARWRDLRAEDRRWALSQWRIAWARSELQKALPERPGLAMRRLERALGELRKEHGRQIRRQGLESLLARARLRETERSRSAVADGSHPPASPGLQGTLSEALTAATRSVLHAPESALRRMVLSQVYGALKDYQLAERERVTALGLGSAAELCCDPRILAGLETEWRETYDAAAEGERPEVLRRAREHLERLLRSVEGGPADGSEATEAQRFQEHAAVHLGLGRICFAAKDWPEAIRHLRIVRESGHCFEEASLLLARALTGNRAPSPAAAVLRDLLDRARGSPVPPEDRLRVAETELRLAWLEARWLDDPEEARRLVESAEGRLRETDGTAPAHLRALGSLCRGELEAHRGRLVEGLKHFKRSVAQSPSPEGYERLVEVLLERAREHGAPGLVEEARSTVRAAWVWNGSHAPWSALSDLEKRLPAAPTA